MVLAPMAEASRTYRPGLLSRLFRRGGWVVMLHAARPGTVTISTGSVATELSYQGICALNVSAGSFWHRVQIQENNKVHELGGLGKASAHRLVKELRQFVNTDLHRLVQNGVSQLNELDVKLQAMATDLRTYLAQSDLAQVMSTIPGDVSLALSHPLFDPSLLPAALKTMFSGPAQLIIDPSARQRYNDAFLAAELSRYRSFFDDLDGRSLSHQQREACIRLDDYNLLVASAGSGKSATMVGKVAYILDKQLCRPQEILVLAFNKSAAVELKQRIARQLGVDEAELSCRVTTFHALGRAIIEEVEGCPPQLANWVEHPAGEARVIEALIEELVRTDQEFARLWINLLVLHPTAATTDEVFDNQKDQQRYLSARRQNQSTTIGTLQGIYVKSLQEQIIANWLWLHSVDFQYERQIPVQDEDGSIRHVRPDFYYSATDTIHEHLAINADGTSPFPDYVMHSRAKMAAYQQAGIDVFFTTSAQASDDTLISKLEAQLTQRGILLERRSYESIVQSLEPVVIKHYHKLIAVCIKHIRANHANLDMLLGRAAALKSPVRAKLFAQAIWKITESYSRLLSETNRIDFDSMLANATSHVMAGGYRSPYAFIMVDEFQDISEPRAKLIKALKNQKAFSRIFAVGDDWQSIYRFAGSDISLFTQFEEHFGQGWQGRLEQTYRCNQLIADTSAAFVQRNPAQLRKSVHSTRPSIARSIRVIPIDGTRGRPDFSTACRRLLMRLDAFLGSIAGQWRNDERLKLKVMVLWRYNQLDPFGGARPQFDHIEVVGLSFHRSKGLEADYTILLDISEGDYGVPSRIEDDELLHLVIPQHEIYEYAEERRLFYVALTRASRGVFLLTNSRAPSRYIRELSEIAGEDLHFETIEGEALVQCPACRVGMLVERRGRNGYRFLGCSQYPACDHAQHATEVGPPGR